MSPEPLKRNLPMSEKVQGVIEKRTLKRWHLIFYLRVFDEDTTKLLGYIADISTCGMMLISDQPILLQRDYNLWVDVPQEDGPRVRVSLKARSLWSKKDVNPDFYDTGFCLINATSEQLHRIQLIIDDFKFHG
jgi:hypothetical protein